MFHNLKFDSEQDYSKVRWFFVHYHHMELITLSSLKVMFNFYELLERICTFDNT